MPIVPIVITLIVVGVLLWGVQQLPIDATIRRVIVVFVVVAVCLWLLGQLSGYGPVITWGSGHRR